MNTICVPKHKFNRMFANVLSVFVILAMAFPVTSVVHAAPDTPFVGKWAAVDVDGSEMNLAQGSGGDRHGIKPRKRLGDSDAEL